MEKPSIQEAQEYFKNAETIECLSTCEKAHFKYMTSRGIYYFIDTIFINFEGDPIRGNNGAKIWDKNNGYAKILEYKNTEPNYEIY